MKRILLLLLLTVCAATYAQDINGRVVGQSGEAIGDATVVLQKSDSTYVDMTITDNEGRFIFSHRIDTFRLVVQHMAYKPL